MPHSMATHTTSKRACAARTASLSTASSSVFALPGSPARLTPASDLLQDGSRHDHLASGSARGRHGEAHVGARTHDGGGARVVARRFDRLAVHGHDPITGLKRETRERAARGDLHDLVALEPA